jgi:hypothetical protein
MSGARGIDLLISDVDGTLVTHDKVLTGAAKDAAAALRTAGVGLTLTSSRPPRGMARFVQPLGLTLPIAGFNGGLLVRPDLSVIERRPIEPDDAAKAVIFLLDRGLDVWVYGETQWFLRNRAAPHVAREAWILGFDPEVTPVFSAVQLKGAFKIVGVSDDPGRMAAAEDAAPAVLGAEVSATRSAAYFLDVTHVRATKAGVVDALAGLLEMPPARIATIGDMPNDVLMFRESGFSIAMGNAADAVKAQASAVTASNEDDGFAKAVHDLILAGPNPAVVHQTGDRP